MCTERSGKRIRLEMVVLEELVPQDHLLRKVDATIDFSFINKICKPYYCENNGCPAIEPKVHFRIIKTFIIFTFIILKFSFSTISGWQNYQESQY